MRIVKQSRKVAGNYALENAKILQKALPKHEKECFTYPDAGMVSAHDALQTWAYKIGKRAFFCMRSSFGSAIVEINPHLVSLLPQKDSHPVQW